MAHFLLVLAPQVHIIITDHFPEYAVEFPILNHVSYFTSRPSVAFHFHTVLKSISRLFKLSWLALSSEKTVFVIAKDPLSLYGNADEAQIDSPLQYPLMVMSFRQNQFAVCCDGSDKLEK